MSGGYGSHSVCLSVCVSVSLTTALAATYLIYKSKVRGHSVSCRLLKMCIVWTLLKTFGLRDMAAFACNNDHGLGSFSSKNRFLT